MSQAHLGSCIEQVSLAFEKPKGAVVRHVDKVPVRGEELSIMLDRQCCYEAVHGRNGYAFAPAHIRYAGSFDMGLLCCKHDWKTCQGFFKSFKVSFFPYSRKNLMENDSG